MTLWQGIQAWQLPGLGFVVMEQSDWSDLVLETRGWIKLVTVCGFMGLVHVYDLSRDGRCFEERISFMATRIKFGTHTSHQYLNTSQDKISSLAKPLFFACLYIYLHTYIYLCLFIDLFKYRGTK